eukprot:scaffold3768_cov69-Phaeocystis_antarctica.AAC.1
MRALDLVQRAIVVVPRLVVVPQRVEGVGRLLDPTVHQRRRRDLLVACLLDLRKLVELSLAEVVVRARQVKAPADDRALARLVAHRAGVEARRRGRGREEGRGQWRRRGREARFGREHHPEHHQEHRPEHHPERAPPTDPERHMPTRSRRVGPRLPEDEPDQGPPGGCLVQHAEHAEHAEH